MIFFVVFYLINADDVKKSMKVLYEALKAFCDIEIEVKFRSLYITESVVVYILYYVSM